VLNCRSLAPEVCFCGGRAEEGPQEHAPPRAAWFLKGDFPVKKDIHPANYREVVFMDVGAGAQWLTRSTIKTEKTIELDGKTYPLHTVDISSASHPFYTGKQKFVDSEGRVQRFQKKFT